MPGRQDWTTVEKIGIPLNLLAAGLVVLFVFGERPLGAATTTVMLEDEGGQTIERVVAKTEFRKSVLIYGFENQTGDTALDWLQLGIRIGLSLDVDQDMYVQAGDAERLQARLAREGHPEAVGMSVPLMASLAHEQHQDYFTFGSFSHERDELSVTISLYETRRQRLLAERTFTGADGLDLVDQMSVQLRRDLGVPESYIEDTKDLPVSDLLSADVEALRFLMLGYTEVYLRNDWNKGMHYLEQSVAADSTSVLAHYMLAAVYLIANEGEKADSAARVSLRYAYKLPDRWGYDVRYFYYSYIKPDPDQRLTIARMKVRLFPEDIEAHNTLAVEYWRRGEFDSAIAEYERILQLDPSQYENLRWIGDVYRDQGAFEVAIRYYERYNEAVPDDFAGLRALGDTYCYMGDHERGKSYFEQALVLDPDNIGVLYDLGTAEYNLGSLDEARERFEGVLEIATTPQDRAAAHSRLSGHYKLLGRVREAIEQKELEWAEREKYEPPALVLVNYKLESLQLFAAAGRESRAFEILRDAEAELAELFSQQIHAGYLWVYLELEDAENAEGALADVEAWVEREEVANMRDDILRSRAKILELRGAYGEAIESYEESLELSPRSVYTRRHIARCHRQLGQLEEAETYLQEHLVVTPFNPDAHYELARVYDDMGDRDRALEHLRIALDVWSEADEEYEPAQGAREMLTELEART
jgi:tetratricopeptide (TPR) repeat protein